MFRGVKKQLQPEAVLLPDGFLPREGWPPSEEEEEEEELQSATDNG
jgi:hypothetical protein